MKPHEIIITGSYSNGLGAASKTIQLQANALHELGDLLGSKALNSGREQFRGTVNMQLSEGSKYLVKQFSLYYPRLDWDKQRRYIKRPGENIGLVKISSITVDKQTFASLQDSYLYFGLKGGHYRRGTMLEILTPVELPVKPGCSLSISVDPHLMQVESSRWFLIKRKTIIKFRKLLRVEDGKWLNALKKLLKSK